MPEQPPSKLYVPAPVRDLPPVASPPVRYVELHCKTNFSFLEGASHPDELVAQAARLGYAGMAVTDRNSLAGAVRAHVAAKEVGLKLVIGAEITPVDAGPILLWAMDRDGYGRLCRLLTRGRRQAPKGECRLAFADVAEHASGLLVGVLLTPIGRPALANYSDGAKSFSIEPTRWPSCIAASAMAGDLDRVATRGPGRAGAADRRGGRALPPSPAALSSGRAHGHPTQNDRRRAGRGSLSQRRTTPEATRRDPVRCSPSVRLPSGAPPKSPTAARSRSTNCGMTIRRNYARPARHRPLTSPG